MSVRLRQRLAALPVAVLAAAAAAPAPAQDAPRAHPAIERALVREISALRTARGLTPVTLTTVLRRPARAHSAWMAASGAFRHEGRDGRPFWSRLEDAGYPSRRPVGEVIALTGGCDAGTARRIAAMWMASPVHRRTLLDPRFRLVGAGVVSRGACARVLATADLGG